LIIEKTLLAEVLEFELKLGSLTVIVKNIRIVHYENSVSIKTIFNGYAGYFE